MLAITPYRQTTNYSCGAASLLMILNFFEREKFPLTAEKEMEIHAESYYGRYGNSEEFYYDYLSAAYSGLALYALKHGFKAKLYQQYPRFKYTSIWPRWVFSDRLRIYDIYLKEALEEGLELAVGDFGIKELIGQVKLGRPAVLLIPGKDTFHNIVLQGFDGKKLRLIDPSVGSLSETASFTDKRINSIRFGKVALCVYR
jgi:hypothetical protein